MDFAIFRLFIRVSLFVIALIACIIYLIKKRKLIYSIFFDKEAIKKEYTGKNDIIFLRLANTILVIVAILLILYLKDFVLDMPEDAERQGLGTPATRAAMIEKLLSAGFVERKGKSLVPTKDGINLAVILPDMLKSPLLTAEWETRLTEIAKGSDDPQSFMQGIEDMTRELVKRYSHITEDGKKLFAPEKEAVGICPRCKSPVYEGKKNFYCSDRSCRFVMWKNDKFFESRRSVFSKKIAAALLKDGKAKVKGLYSERTGKTYDGTVLLCDTGEKYVNYRIEQRK